MMKAQLCLLQIGQILKTTFHRVRAVASHACGMQGLIGAGEFIHPLELINISYIRP